MCALYMSKNGILFFFFEERGSENANWNRKDGKERRRCTVIHSTRIPFIYVIKLLGKQYGGGKKKIS